MESEIYGMKNEGKVSGGKQTMDRFTSIFFYLNFIFHSLTLAYFCHLFNQNRHRKKNVLISNKIALKKLFFFVKNFQVILRSTMPIGRKLVPHSSL